MMYRLNIDNGVEVELKHDLHHMLHGKLLCFEFICYEKTMTSRGFILPNHYEDLVSFLFDISLTKTIEHAFRVDQVCAGEHYLSAYQFRIVDSENHHTNITPEFMTAIAKWNDEMKKEVQDG